MAIYHAFGLVPVSILSITFMIPDFVTGNQQQRVHFGVFFYIFASSSNIVRDEQAGKAHYFWIIWCEIQYDRPQEIYACLYGTIFLP